MPDFPPTSYFNGSMALCEGNTGCAAMVAFCLDPDVWGSHHDRARFISCVMGVMQLLSLAECWTADARIAGFCRLSSLGCTEQEACVFSATLYGSGMQLFEKAAAGTLLAAQTPVGFESSGGCQMELEF